MLMHLLQKSFSENPNRDSVWDQKIEKDAIPSHPTNRVKRKLENDKYG